ncbi:hypothetical protein ACFQY0_18060 [Haloferula chungangensis]|uniref:Uncharacterized protein n=1 Tax=Haloferula chungangensis TaxID=1048331 RepID=A0ABW2LCP2_9BACT
MKPLIPFALLGAILAVGANAATTDPVGYISHTISTGSPSLTVLSPTLVQPVEYSSVSTVSPSGGSTITLPAGVPSDFNTGDVLEITDGESEGWWSTVVSSTDTTIVIFDEFPAGLDAATPISVRAHNTIQSFLGDNNPGLAPFDGATGDEVQILNPDQSLVQIAFVPAAVSGAAEDGWYNLVTLAPEGDRVIEPGSAVIIKSSTSAELTFQSTGAVKLTDTQVDLFPGLTLVGQVDAVGATLGEMNLATQLNQFDGSNSDFDEFQILNSDQSLTQYAALAPGVAGPEAVMANLVTTADATNIIIEGGTGAILKRDASQAASSITVPGSSVAP